MRSHISPASYLLGLVRDPGLRNYLTYPGNPQKNDVLNPEHANAMNEIGAAAFGPGSLVVQH